MLTEEAALLETFENKFQSQDYVITHTQPEFTSVCPKTGHPDFATIVFTYIADKKCVELKSYKLWLQTFRNKGIFYEPLANTLLADLVELLDPREAEIRAMFTPRGGINSVIVAKYKKSQTS